MSGRSFAVYPTKVFAGLMFVVATMWYAAASQNNTASYLLLFVTLSVFAVSIPQTLLNVTRLQVSAEAIKPTFAGQEAAVSIEIANRSRQSRRSCVLSLPNVDAAPETVDEIAPQRAARVTLRFPAEARGQHELSRIELRSMYPLGFFAARRAFAIRQSYVVYPAPSGDPKLPTAPRKARSHVEALTGEGDDYAGVRAYVPGESQRHIDWKAVARGQPLMTKQFTAESGDAVRLDFAATTGRDVEEKLSQLALWIIEAERARRRYELRLPGAYFAAASGEMHYHRCLRALALHR